MNDDHAILQVDMSGINPDSSAIEPQSLFKYMSMLERTKKITKHHA